MTASPTLSIVVPAFNEAVHLESSLDTIRVTAQSLGVPFEIIVVDDGSWDDTWPLLKQQAEMVPELRAVCLARNFGKEAAIRAGLEVSLGAAVIMMDCDLQHPPALIPRMFELWRNEQYKVVNGLKNNRGEESLANSVAAKSFYRLFERLSGVRLAGSSDFKLLDREVVSIYCDLPERNTFFRGIVPWVGFKQIDIPFAVEGRTAGDSKWSLLKRLFLAVNAIVSFSAVPLQFVTIAGLLFFIFAMVLAGQTLYVHLSGGAVEGFTTVILLLVIIGSILMLSLGVIGQYLAKIYEELKRRPQYLVKEQIRARAPDSEPVSRT